MKKAILPFLLAVVAALYLPCCLSCTETKPEPEPEPEPIKDNPVTTTITASDVTVEEGKTAQIGAATNSSAAIAYSSSDVTIATVSPAGLVTGVKAGSTTITLSVPAVEGKFTAAEKVVGVTVTAVETPPDNKPKPGTYTFTASPLKGQWNAGDQIYIQGGYGPAAQVVTLTADQISADGKTASADLDGDLFKYFSDPDPFYAVWPAEAVQKEDGLTNKVITFSVCDILLTQAYLDGTNFGFVDVSSFISFTVSGGYDHVIITGARRPGLRYSSNYKNEYSSVKSSAAKPTDDGYPYREESLEADGTLKAIYFPGGITFTGGFTLYFSQGDNWSAAYTYPESITIKAGQKLELGDISGQLQPYNGEKPHMPDIIKYTKYTEQFNELSGICVDLSGDFLWAVGDGSEICRISLDGKLLEHAYIFTFDAVKEKPYKIDSEGITIDYDTGDILICGEANVVCRISASDIDEIFTRTFLAKLDEEKDKLLIKELTDAKVLTKENDEYYRIKAFNGVKSVTDIADARNFGNSGAEGCTYYKDGLLYVGTQTGSYLYCCDLATGDVLWRKGLREMHPVIKEIAGLSYDPLTDWLWVIDSESHKFFALTGDAEHLLGSYVLKTRSNEESICVDHRHNCVWVGDDSDFPSYVYKYEMIGLDDFVIDPAY